MVQDCCGHDVSPKQEANRAVKICVREFLNWAQRQTPKIPNEYQRLSVHHAVPALMTMVKQYERLN